MKKNKNGKIIGFLIYCIRNTIFLTLKEAGEQMKLKRFKMEIIYFFSHL